MNLMLFDGSYLVGVQGCWRVQGSVAFLWRGKPLGVVCWSFLEGNLRML